MAQCPRLQNHTVPDNIITKDNINDLVVSTQVRTIGIKVDISCYDGRYLEGASQLQCVADGSSAKWNPDKPRCIVGTPPSDTGLTQQELIVIGVVAAICALVLIMVIVMLLACFYKRRRDRVIYKQQASEYSYGSEMDRFKPYSAYAPFPGPLDRNHRYYTSSLPRSSLPDSFPRTNHTTAYELAVRSAGFRPKPYTNYAGPRIARAGSDTYEDYLAEKNYRPFVVGGTSRSYDNEGFRGEWTDRYNKKRLSDFNSDAFGNGRDPFLWENAR